MLTQTTPRMPDSPHATPAPESRTAMPPLRYPLGEHLPQSGTVTEVAPGVFWLRMGWAFPSPSTTSTCGCCVTACPTPRKPA
jgi:hypothetical protein